MTGILFLAGPDNEKYGTVEINSDSVDWTYTGPDPDGRVKEYLKRVEDKDAYDWHPEVDPDATEKQFNEMYILEIYRTLEYFDHPARVVTKGL